VNEELVKVVLSVAFVHAKVTPAFFTVDQLTLG